MPKELKGKQPAISNIYCVARNYHDHARELGNTVPIKPVFFQKSVAALTSAKTVKLPDEGEIHNELEIVVLIGEPGFGIPAEKAWDHVKKIALGLDFTDRGLQTQFKAKGLPWWAAKSFYNSAYLGPLETVDRQRWQQDFWLRRNDREIQRGNIDQMVFGIPELISHLSQHVPLMEGDLLYTGTPAGVGPVFDGDILELGLGGRLVSKIKIQR